jgi:redox-sensitive bicupin YhaK (pirin superfamily)
LLPACHKVPSIFSPQSKKENYGKDKMVTRSNTSQAGWLDLPDEAILSDLQLNVGEEGNRFILYAGKPTGDNIASHGPLIADSSEDIQRVYREYRQGEMKHITTVAGG